jgi:small subunit ribosomal protein S23
MGRALQIRPARVLETVTQEVRSGIMFKYKRLPPPWLDVMHRIPPSEKMARTVPVAHREPSGPPMMRPRRTFIPQRIKFVEDHLRRVFYKHHPWELARPRIVAETDGCDAQMVRWDRGLQQPGMPLSGERWVSTVN